MPTKEEIQALHASFKLEYEAFDKAVKRFVTQFGGFSETQVKRVGFELMRRTVLRTTRVDTGRMRNGWHVTFHRPSVWTPKDGRTAKPDAGNDSKVLTLFLQNNVFYAVIHEFGSRRGLAPLLMLTASVVELRSELEKSLADGMPVLWNREINGVSGAGLTEVGKIAKEEFLKRFEGGAGKVGARRQRTEFTSKRKRKKRP